ncbi:MAG: GNAT family N-acetyltransferase [Candidatus Obscuribacterales bacterium]|nr:GNAT family N-acetyltransferase [Candidatus Obscuribacterales bacterium]
MSLERAEWHDVLTVLRETVSIWSTGLTPHDYRRYIWLQMHHFWGRNNFRFYVYKENNEIKSSCKLYTIKIASRGKEYTFCGVGAVHTLTKHRGNQYARALLKEVVDLCESENYDGMVLFSDIGPDLYEDVGFIEIGSAEFSVYLEPANDAALTEVYSSLSFQPLREADLDVLIRHHRRWIRHQPFGVVRDSAYWKYKIAREDFLNVNSNLSWPQLQVTLIDGDTTLGGYAITECGGNTLRVMEVVGSDDACVKLWTYLFAWAEANQIKRIRGWEALIRDFEPNYKFESVLSPSLSISEMHYSERSWGRCMMLPINPEIDDWLDVNPCPVLELDHL